jgi:hypothetical protein
MYPPEAIDFENPYVSPYLRRRCRSLAEVEAAYRDGAAALKETQEGRPGSGDGLTIDVSMLIRLSPMSTRD